MKKQMTENSKNKIPNSNNGITLIALVITIIVMLILVAVTISMAINGGLFEKAGEAVGKTENAIDKEQELASGKIKIGNTVYNSINEYLGRLTEQTKPVEPINPTGVHNWTRGTGENIDVFTCSHCNKSYTMGDVVNYTDAGVASTTITAAKSGLDESYMANSSKYPEEANVSSDGSQTIEAQNSTWIVLGIEDTNGDGMNETLLITTQSPVGVTNTKKLWVYGAAAYNNIPSYYTDGGDRVEGELDKICKKLYSNSEYGDARGMTIEDINNALNYTPVGGMLLDMKNYNIYTTGNLTTRLQDMPSYLWETLVHTGTKTPDPTDEDSESDFGKYILDGYTYSLEEGNFDFANVINLSNNSVVDARINVTPIEKNTIFGPNVEGDEGESEEYPYSYMLSSRGVMPYFFGSVSMFFNLYGVFCVDTGTVLSMNSFNSFLGNEDGEGEGYMFRPVVALMDKLPETK